MTGDLLAVNNKQRLYRASMTTRTLLTGWNGISLTSFGLLDTRAVEVIGEQVLVTDGADSNVRPHTDPMAHAVFVLDVSGPTGPAPTASFTATPTTGSVPLTVNFTDTSTGGPTSWAWTFGDGGTSTAQSPSHTYTSTGTFTASLTATNGQGSTSTTRAITVTQPTAPTASFTATPTTGSVPLTVNFTDTSTGGPTSWAWDLRGRRHIDRAIAVAHLHQHRDVHRQPDRNQRAGLHVDHPHHHRQRGADRVHRRPGR